MSRDLEVNSGETEAVASGATERYRLGDVSGTLQVEGTLQFTGGTQIAGRTVDIDRQSLTLEPMRLSLSFHADRDDIGYWRGYDRAGDTQETTAFGGDQETLDRAGRGTITVQMPPDLSPPLQTTSEWYVSSYNDEQEAPDRFTVSLGLSRPATRVDEFATVSQSGDWEFATERGTVGLKASAVSLASRQGTTAAGQYDLTLWIDDTQAATFVDALGKPAGVLKRSVPDGKDFLSDSTPNTRQTVTISSPSGATVVDGDYICPSWQLSDYQFGPAAWQLDLTLWEQ